MVISPRSNGSKKLMHDSNVLFPDPLGPMTVTTSPR
jgi:hypothetical protein